MNFHLKSVPGRVLILLLIGLSMASCTPRKKLIYLQPATHEQSRLDTIYIGADTVEYRLQEKDILYITIRGLDEQTTNAISGSNDRVVQPNDAGVYLNSHTIDEGGNVTLPIIGTIRVTGYTVEEARLLLQSEVEKYIKEPWVNLKLAHFKVTMLGEVIRPGVYKIYEHNVTLLEALGYAGDLTNYGNRQEIMIIREDAQHQRSVAYVDLSNRDFLSSEYYHLMPNDVVYVKSYASKTYGLKEFPWLSVVSTIATLVSTAVTVYLFTKD
jgi:polysaccharide biosynthesis/export protein